MKRGQPGQMRPSQVEKAEQQIGPARIQHGRLADGRDQRRAGLDLRPQAEARLPDGRIMALLHWLGGALPTAWVAGAR